MGKRTTLYAKHVDAGAKLVDFAGWDMPINYGSQIEEHQQVRGDCGVFDVSHMTVLDIRGRDGLAFLRYLLANDVARLDQAGKALYSAMLNESGGVVDDLIAYRMSFGFRLVVNCATRDKDLAWMDRHGADYELLVEERPDLAILAIHGPRSLERVSQALPQFEERVAALGNFQGFESDDYFIARTGYTGEKGVEIIFPAAEAPAAWDALLAAGVKPIGLGARDTLRLEAGMNLYGHDMDEDTSPLAANMGFSLAWEPADRNFIGRSALTVAKERQQAGELPHLVGLVLEGRGVLREGQAVNTDRGPGVITSGSFSPTLKHSIALARIPMGSESCQVDMRGTLTPLRIVKPSFVRFGKKVFE